MGFGTSSGITSSLRVLSLGPFLPPRPFRLDFFSDLDFLPAFSPFHDPLLTGFHFFFPGTFSLYSSFYAHLLSDRKLWVSSRSSLLRACLFFFSSRSKQSFFPFFFIISRSPYVVLPLFLAFPICLLSRLRSFLAAVGYSLTTCWCPALSIFFPVFPDRVGF